jgi:hypothetical protein
MNLLMQGKISLQVKDRNMKILAEAAKIPGRWFIDETIALVGGNLKPQTI